MEERPPKSAHLGGETPCVLHNNRNWIFGLLLVLAVMAVYQPVWHAGFIWDDDAYVTKNPLLVAPDGLKRIWFSMDSPSQYFPLTYTMFRLERSVWGLQPSGYHWVNILLHAANAILVWSLLSRLMIPGAWLAAALFALHPVQVETVAWISERKNVLSLLFYLLAMLSWVRFVEKSANQDWKHYAAALLFYVLALCAKTTACTLPAAMSLVLWLKHWPINRARLLQLLPFILLGLGMGLVTIWWEKFHQGTQGNVFSMDPLQRILLASRAIWFYAGKLFWPVDLTFSYPRWTINASNILAYAWLVIGVGLIGAIWATRRFLGRGPEVAIAFYAATLSPLLGFIMLYTFRYTFVADHYQYVASIGLFTLVSAGIIVALAHRAVLKFLVSGVLLLALATLTWRQAGNYKDSQVLWRDTLTKNPGSWLAETSLGAVLIGEGHTGEALKHCLNAVRLNPDSAESQNNLGVALAARHRYDEAVQCYRKAIQLEPEVAESFNNLGVALMAQGRVDEAIKSYQEAIRLDTSYPDALDNLGVAFYGKGKLDEAIASLREAIRLGSKRPESLYHLGLALSQAGRTSEAIATYREALASNPDMPAVLNNLAWALATSPDDQLRDGIEAVRLAKRACELGHEEQPVFMGTLAAAYAETGQFDEATATAERALALAQSLGEKSLAMKEAKLLQLFASHQPYRDKSGQGD